MAVIYLVPKKNSSFHCWFHLQWGISIFWKQNSGVSLLHYISINLSFYQNCNSARVKRLYYQSQQEIVQLKMEVFFYRIEMRLKNIFYLFFHISTTSKQQQHFYFFKKTPHHFELNLKKFHSVFIASSSWLYKISVRVLTKKSFATKYSHVPCHHGFYRMFQVRHNAVLLSTF